jgi:hypothetical protein
VSPIICAATIFCDRIAPTTTTKTISLVECRTRSLMMSTDDDDEVDELFMLLLSLETLMVEVEEVVLKCESNLSQHIKEQQRLNRSLPVDKLRPRWVSFSSRLSSTHFRRMF